MKNVVHNFFRNILNNVKLILVSILVSLVIWFAISLQLFPNITAHITEIPVDAAATPYMLAEGLKIDEDFGYSKNTSIQIQGKRYDIGNLSKESFKAVLDLSSVTSAGEYIVAVDVEQIGGETCTILTNNITTTIKVDRVITKTFSLEANIDEIEIIGDMQIDTEGLATTPSEVTITGEESLVNSIGSAQVVASYDGVLDASTEMKGKLTLFSASGTKIENPDLSIPAASYTVTVPICKVKTLPLRISFTGYPSNFDLESLNYKIYPEELTISSPDDSIDNLSYIEIGEIPLSSLTVRDLQGANFVISLPEGYKNISGNKTATVTFADSDSYGKLEFTVPAENFSIINAPQNFDISILTEQLPVTVIGPSEDLLQMTSSDIYVSVNLLGVEMSEGTKSVTVSFRLLGGNIRTWVTGEEYKIDIKATAIPEEVIE